jgi:hypothetical protein
MANNCQLIVLLGTTFGKCKTMKNIVPRIVSRHILDTFLTLLSHICYAGAPLRCAVAMCCVEVSQFVTLRHKVNHVLKVSFGYAHMRYKHKQTESENKP